MGYFDENEEKTGASVLADGMSEKERRKEEKRLEKERKRQEKEAKRAGVYMTGSTAEAAGEAADGVRAAAEGAAAGVAAAGAEAAATTATTADAASTGATAATAPGADGADGKEEEKSGAAVLAEAAEAAEEEGEEGGKKKRKKKKKKDEKPKDVNLVKELLSLIIYIGIVVLICFLIITFVGRRTTVHGSSMEPTLQSGDSLWINMLAYRFGDPERYDIIVFPYQDEVHYIKRIRVVFSQCRGVVHDANPRVVFPERPVGECLLKAFCGGTKIIVVRTFAIPLECEDPGHHDFGVGEVCWQFQRLQVLQVIAQNADLAARYSNHQF